jgi:hypothetical protein
MVSGTVRRDTEACCEGRSYAPNKCLDGYEPRSKRTPGPPKWCPCSTYAVCPRQIFIF